MHSNQPVNILLVDDEPANLLGLKAVLESLGQNLVFANSGEEALKHLLTTDFAAILLDIRMPTMSGFEVARLVRDRPRSSRTAILFLTAADDADVLVEEAYALGAVDFLRKPLNPTIVRAKIAIFVDLHRKTEDLTRIERERHALALNAKEDRIRLILDNVKDYAFVGTDRDGVIREWEGGAEAITGWTAAEAVGRPAAILFSEADAAAGQPALERRLATEHGRHADQRWQRGRDGRAIYAEGALIALHDKHANLQGFVKIFRDATGERRAAEQMQASAQRLRESEARVALATRAGGLGVWTWVPGESDKIVWENELPYEIFGRSAELPPPTIAEFVAEYLHPDDLAAYQAALASMLEQQAPFYFVGRYTRPGDAAVRWLELTGRYYDAVGARPAQVLGTMSEITERKRAEEELRRLAANLAEVDQRKTAFLATLGHELRNPLAPIANALAILAYRQDNPEAVGKMRAIMQRQVDHMIHLIDDLLDVARINGGKIQLKKQKITVAAILASAVETSQPLIDAARHELSVSMPPHDIHLEVDPVRIAQVLSNLLNNAAKYTPSGGRLEVAVRCLTDSVTISVADNGVGIPPAEQHRIFEMFNQVDDQLARAQGGLGIGLALVQHLVSMHDGTVSVVSPGSGRGSEFSVRLPWRGDAGAAAPPLAAVATAGAAAAAAASTTAAPALRVLVVDVNADAAQTLVALLESLGHVAECVTDGAAAAASAGAVLPDIVFIEIGTATTGGYDTALALRAIAGMAGATLVALSGSGAEADVARAKRAGFSTHVLKPLNLDLVSGLLVGHQAAAAEI